MPDRRYQRLKAEHRCTRCSIPLPEDYKPTKCPQCIENIKKRRKAYHDKLRELGVCIICCREDAVEGYAYCKKCYEKQRDYARLRYKTNREKGLCSCGRERDDPNLKTCSKCRARAQKSRLRQKGEKKCSHSQKMCEK